MALVRFLIEQDDANASTMEEWISLWTPRVMRAATALAPLFKLPETEVRAFEAALAAVRQPWQTMIAEIGLSIPKEGAA